MRVRELGLVTGAASGIGYELARCCAAEGLDLIVVSDDHRIHEAANSLRTLGTEIVALQVDLATDEGLGDLLTVIDARPLDVLIANAGHGLGGAFLEQEFEKVRRVIDTNITGTLKLLHTLAPRMCALCEGRILITGSIAGYLPGAFPAVYNGTKAFIDSFTIALRDELKDSGVTVTCLMHDATETRFFERAGVCDAKFSQAKKDAAAAVAKSGYDAMKRGVVTTGPANKRA